MEEIQKAIEAKLETVQDFEAKIRLLEAVKNLARDLSRTLHRDHDQAMYESELRGLQEKWGKAPNESPAQTLAGSSGLESAGDFGQGVV